MDQLNPQNERSSLSEDERLAEITVQRLRNFTAALETGENALVEKFTTRKIVLHATIEPCSPDRIRLARRLMNLSQPLFATLLNMKVSTLQKWESGAKKPNGAAARLIDEILRDPIYWQQRVKDMTQGSCTTA